MQWCPNWTGTSGDKRRSADTWYEQSSGCPARQGSAFFDVRMCYPNAKSHGVLWIFINQEGRELQYYNVMDSHLSFIRPPEVCAAMHERLTMYAKSSAEHYRKWFWNWVGASEILGLQRLIFLTSKISRSFGIGSELARFYYLFLLSYPSLKFKK